MPQLRRKAGAAGVALAMGLALAQAAIAQPPDDELRERLFERAFGRRPSRAAEVTLPLIVANRQVGQVAVVGAPEPTAARAATLLPLIEPLLDPATFEQVKSAQAPDGTIAFAAI